MVLENLITVHWRLKQTNRCLRVVLYATSERGLTHGGGGRFYVLDRSIVSISQTTCVFRLRLLSKIQLKSYM
jgi:hypothetical protein